MGHHPGRRAQAAACLMNALQTICNNLELHHILHLSSACWTERSSSQLSWLQTWLSLTGVKPFQHVQSAVPSAHALDADFMSTFAEYWPTSSASQLMLQISCCVVIRFTSWCNSGHRSPDSVHQAQPDASVLLALVASPARPASINDSD